MATGILSIAADGNGQRLLSDVLLAIGGVAVAALIAVELRRTVLRSRVSGTDLDRPQTALDMLTWVAACGVLGERLGAAAWPLESALWAVGLAIWMAASAVLLRSLLAGRETGRARPLSGSWLLLVVGPQSLAVLGSSIAQQRASASLMAVSLTLFAIGLALYAAVIIPLLRRIIGGHVGLGGHTPDYWITMGALAISALAATHLAEISAGYGGLKWFAALLLTTALGCWTVASSWIPYLGTVEVARAARYPDSLTYESRRWSMVFPLGMYCAATQQVAGAAGLTLGPLANLFFWLGLSAWVLTAGAMVRAWLVANRQRPC